MNSPYLDKLYSQLNSFSFEEIIDLNQKLESSLSDPNACSKLEPYVMLIKDSFKDSKDPNTTLIVNFLVFNYTQDIVKKQGKKSFLLNAVYNHVNSFELGELEDFVSKAKSNLRSPTLFKDSALEKTIDSLMEMWKCEPVLLNYLICNYAENILEKRHQ